MAFTGFPIPTRKAQDLPTISTLPEGQYVVAATTEGFRRILKTDVGLARIFVQSAAPTGTRTSQDFWINPNDSPKHMQWWNGTEWERVTYLPSKEELQNLLELGTAAVRNVGIDPGEIPTLNAQGEWNTAHIPTIANSKLAEMPANTIKARSGTSGAPQNLTPTQARQVLELGNAALVNVGNSVGQVPAVQSNGRLSTSVIPSVFNAVIVRSVNDFGVISGGVVTLQDNTTYIVSGTINMVQLVDVRIVAGNNSSIIGLDPANTALVYNGSAPFLTATNVNLFIQGIAFVCPNAPVFDWASNGTHFFTSDFVSVIGGEVGSFVGGKNLAIFRNNWRDVEDGIIVAGTWDKVLLGQSVCETSAGTSSGAAFRIVGASETTAEVSGAGVAGANGTYHKITPTSWINDDNNDFSADFNPATDKWFISDADTGFELYESSADGTTAGPFSPTSWTSLDVSFDPAPSVVSSSVTSSAVIISGAGTSAANGTYIPVGTLNGRTRYRLGSTDYFVEFDFIWRIRFAGLDLYTGSSATNPWDVSSWSPSLSGAPLVPTVTEGGVAGTVIEDIDIFGNKFQSNTIKAIVVDDPSIVNGQATIINNRFRGTADFIDGVDSLTPDWTLRDNTGLPNAAFAEISATSAIPQAKGQTYQIVTDSITVTLPTSPLAGDFVTFINYSGSSSLIAGGGADIRSGSTVANSEVSIADSEVFKLIYNGTDWLLTT